MVGRPSRAKEARRTILDGAADMFSKRGYRATSMNEIATGVGLSKPTLYHYFRNKEEILVRLYEEVMAEAVESATMIAASVDDPLEALRRMLVHRVQSTCERQAMYKVFFEEEAELPTDLIHSVVDQRREYERIFRGQVQRYLDSVESPPPSAPPLDLTVVVNTCLGAANWVYKWYRSDGRLTPEQLGDQIATYVLRPLSSWEGAADRS